MTERPVILLSGPREGWSNYENAVLKAGGLVRGGFCPPADLSCQGLVLCGGGDADPALYRQENHGSHPSDPGRDRAELELIEAFLAAGKPILGVCRGLQMLNIALGGTLVQDLPLQQAPFHCGEGGDRVHPVRVDPEGFLGRLYAPCIQVNSSHHQAVDRLGEGLRDCAWSEGGVVEALEHRTRPVLGVQFHPERMAWDHRRADTADGAPVWLYFLSLCTRYSRHT